MDENICSATIVYMHLWGRFFFDNVCNIMFKTLFSVYNYARNVTWPGSLVNELLVVWRIIAKLSELTRINGRQVCVSDWS